MAEIPDTFLVHQVTVTPFTGTGGVGDVYGPPVAIKCRLEDHRQLVLDPNGDQAVSETRFFARLADKGFCPPGSKVALPDGRVSKVLNRAVHDDGGRGAWQHIEVTLQ